MALFRHFAVRLPSPMSGKRWSSSNHFFPAAIAVILLFFIVNVQFSPWSNEQLSDVSPKSWLTERTLEYVESPASNKTKILVPRITGDPDNPDWDSRVGTGNMLWCMMQSPATIQSPYTENDLGRYEYVYGPISPGKMVTYRENLGSGSAPAYGTGGGSLGLNVDNEIGEIYVQADNWYDDDGEEWLASLGSFSNIVNGPDGYIMACDNLSPLEANVGGVPPPLSKWSDIVAIEWSQFAVPQGAEPLRVIIQSGITNLNTMSIIQQAFEVLGQNTVPVYPGVDIEWTDTSTAEEIQAFKGLLGTYHGAGPAYMLGQHRALFGQKMINRIRVWATPVFDVNTGDLTTLQPSMAFFVVDVPT